MKLIKLTLFFPFLLTLIMCFAVTARAQRCGVPGKPDCPPTSTKPSEVRRETKAEAEERRRREDARLLAKIAEQRRRAALQQAPSVPRGSSAKRFMSEAKDYFFKAEYVKAILSYSKSIEANPNYSEAYYDRGFSNTQIGKFDAAIADYTSALKIDDKYTEAYNNRGKLLYMEKMNPEAAIQDFSLAITCFPYDIDPAVIYTNRGKAYQFIEKSDAAIEDFGKAIESDSKFDEAYFRRGIIYLERKNYDAAIADFDNVLAIKPLHLDAPKYKTKALDEQKAYQAKIAKLKEVAQTSPNNFDSFYYLGNAYRENNDPDNAISNYDNALSLKSDSKFAYLNRGTAYLDKKNYDAALRDFNEVISRDQNYAPAYRMRGLAYFGKGDYDAAINEFSETLTRDSKIVDAYFKRALAYMEKKTPDAYEAARLDLTEYVARNPTFPATYRIRAYVYDRLSESSPQENRQKLKDDAERDRMTAKDRYQR